MFFHGIHLLQDNSRSSKTSPDNVNQPTALVKTATCGFFLSHICLFQPFRIPSQAGSSLCCRTFVQHTGIINIFRVIDHKAQHAEEMQLCYCALSAPQRNRALLRIRACAQKNFRPAGQTSVLPKKQGPLRHAASQVDCARQSGPL